MMIIENELVYDNYIANAKDISDDKKAKLMSLKEDLKKLGYFEAPASLSHHTNTTGGLYLHSQCVANNLLMLTKKLELIWERPESPYIVGLFHDLCKADCYKHAKPIDDGDISDKWEYNNSSILTGHGDRSVILTQKLLSLTDEEIACIRWHMGAFDDKENWNNYGHAVTLYPNVLWTHTADMMAARIDGV